MGKEAKTIPLTPKAGGQKQKHYYKLSIDCELGRQVMDLIKKGIRSDKVADTFAKSLGAKFYIPSPYADFGGINAFVLPNEPQPDQTVWQYVEGFAEDKKLGIYIFKVNVDTHVCMFDELKDVPDDDRHIKGKVAYSFEELLGTVPMKDIAAAAGIKTKYTDPVVFLEYLKFSKEEIEKYRSGKVSIRTMIAKKFIASKRDKQMAQLAVNADAEVRKNKKELADKKFALFNFVKGTDVAVHNFSLASALPCIPAGTLNRMLSIPVGIRVGFALANGWLYFISANPSEKECDDNFMAATEEEINTVIEQIKVNQKVGNK